MTASPLVDPLYDNFNIKKKKIVWLGNLQDLKTVISNEINEEAAINSKWRSPGEGTWKLESEDLSVTWYSMSNNVCFKGTLATDLENRINERLNATKPNPTIIVEDAVRTKST